MTKSTEQKILIMLEKLVAAQERTNRTLKEIQNQDVVSLPSSSLSPALQNQ